MDTPIEPIPGHIPQENYMPLRYCVVPENYYRFELGKYQTYGIELITPNYSDVLHDVSVYKNITEHIVSLLNQHQVSPIHLYAVVTDILP